MAGPPANHIFTRQVTGFKYKVFERSEKLAVEMGNILKKMRHEVPCRLFWFDVFLTANMTKPVVHMCIAVKTGFFLPFFKVTQVG